MNFVYSNTKDYKFGVHRCRHDMVSRKTNARARVCFMTMSGDTDEGVAFETSQFLT